MKARAFDTVPRTSNCFSVCILNPRQDCALRMPAKRPERRTRSSLATNANNEGQHLSIADVTNVVLAPETLRVALQDPLNTKCGRQFPKDTVNVTDINSSSPLAPRAQKALGQDTTNTLTTEPYLNQEKRSKGWLRQTLRATKVSSQPRLCQLTWWLLAAALLASTAHAQKPSLATSKRRDVYIAGFFPFGRQVAESGVGRGVMPSVMLAVDHVNENPDVLRNYMLHMYWNDTECNTAVGVKAFFDMMHMRPAKVMLFGAACTHVTDPIAKASKRWHLTQLSYADTHPMFTPRHFPNFFRVVPSENAFNLPRLKLLETFNWTRVGTIYQNEPRYSLAHNHLVADLDTMGFQIAETQSFGNEVVTAMSKLKQKDVRIILGNFNESWARRVFCEAHRAGMFGRKYQWLIMGTYADQWWAAEEGVVPCAPNELQAALEGCILTDLLPLSTSGEITVSGITADEYLAEYDSRRGGEYSRFHGYTYDGIWAVALAIQHVARRVRLHRKNATVADFRYRDPLWETLFLEALRNTSFEGVTGPVRFYDNERKASILLKQFQNGSELKVGEFNGVTGQLDLTRGGPIRWQGRHPPKDRTRQIFEHSHVNVTLYAGIAATASVGIVIAAVFLAVNIRYRNQRYIKMSSPYLNNLIIVGCMLTYSSVLFLGLDSTLTSIDSFPYICTARAWLLMAGFSLAFGSMFSKTWRVHSIFTDVTLNKKVIKDYQLFMVVGILLFVDLAIMTTWQVADPFYRETKQMEPYPHPSSEDILIIPENEYCASEQMTVFVGSIYAYKGLLMIFGAFLAWETRNVNIPALNDSKYVGMSVYNVVIMCIMGAAVSFVLSDKQDASFVLISVFIIFCTTGTLCLVFVPKLVELRRNPHGSIDKRCRATLRPVSKTRRDSAAHEAELRLRDAKSGNAALRAQLAGKDAELAALLRRLGDEADAGADRLQVPSLLRREAAPSGTETTDVSSLCSLTSSQDGGDYVNLAVDTPQRVKKAVFAGKQSALAVSAAREIAALVGGAVDTEDRPRMATPPTQQQPLVKVVSFGDVTETSAPILLPPRQFVPRVPSASVGCVRHGATPPATPSRPHDNVAMTQRREDGNVTSFRDDKNIGGYREDGNITSYRDDVIKPPYRDNMSIGMYREEINSTAYRDDMTMGTFHEDFAVVPGRGDVSMTACRKDGRRRSSFKASPPTSAQRRTSVPCCHANQAQLPGSRRGDANLRGLDRRDLADLAARQRDRLAALDGGDLLLSSLVRHSPRDLDRDSASMQRSVSAKTGRQTATQQRRRRHAQSTPDVAHPAASVSSLCAAASEGELLDLAILPIFQKLLAERLKRRPGYGASVASCPNISIKCDIVEYL